MSEKTLGTKLDQAATGGQKSPSEPPLSPRTGRPHDDIDMLPDVPAAVTSDFYKKLEALQEAFFPIDKAKRFQPIDTKGWTGDTILQQIEANPFHSKLIYELLRRVRKGLIPIETAAKYYSDSKKNKRNLVDNIVARKDAGAIKFTKLDDGRLESLELEEFLESLFDTGFITPVEVQEFNHSPELDTFIKQLITDRDLPVAKPVTPGFQPPNPSNPAPKPGILAKYHPIVARGKTLAPMPTAPPESAPTVPAVPSAFKVPSPPATVRKATLLGMSAVPPAAGSAPGAPAHSMPVAVAPPLSAPYIPKPNPTVAPRPSLSVPPSSSAAKAGPSAVFSRDLVFTEVPPESKAALTVRQGAGRTSPADPRAALPTLADHDATKAALGREATQAAIEILPAPVSVVATPDVIPPTSRPPVAPKKPSHLPPPMPGDSDPKSAIETKETDFQLLHAVTIINEAGITTDVPLLLQDGEFTIGTNPRNDIVLQNPVDCETVAEFHAVIKIAGDQITVKGVKGPVKLEAKPDRRGLVTHNHVPVEAGEKIKVGRVKAGKADRFIEISVKLDEAFHNVEIKDQLSERCKSLLRAAGQKIVESIQESDAVKPDIIDKKSDEAKLFAKKAQEIFQGLSIRLQDELKDSDFITWKSIALSEAQTLLAKRFSESITAHGQELLLSTRKAVKDAIANGTEISAINLGTDLPKFFADYLTFARVHGIDVRKNEYLKEIDQATSEAKRFLAEKKQVEADIKEADRRRAELEDEVKNRPQRDHETALAHFRKIYAGVHFRERGDGSELLTLDTKFAHEGAVLVIRDTSGKIIENGIRPLLTHHETLGTHDINTIELPNDHDPRRGTKPFMASIEFDEKIKRYRMTWIDGEIRLANDEGGIGTPTTPVFTVESNKAVFVGKYLIKIEENHAFTQGSITAEYANPHAEELTEIIFDEAVTTLDQTEKAYNELKTLAATGFVDMGPLREHLTKKITDLWEKLEKWSPNISIEQAVDADAAPTTPGRNQKVVLADAQALGILHLLLKDRGGFIPRIRNISQAEVIEAAKKRLDAYIAFDNKSKEPGAKFPKIVGLFSAGKARLAEQAKQKEVAKARANIGVVEVARFLDMGVFKQEVVNGYPDISEEYCDRINEIYRVRKLIDEIRNGGKDIGNFEQVMELSGDKTMDEVFSPDEIAAFNVNIEINIAAKTPVQQYLKKLFVFLARTHVRQLGNVENQKSIATIEKLLEIKAVTYDDIVVPPYFMGNEVKSTIEDAKMLAQIKSDAEKEEAILRADKIRVLQNQAEIKRIHRQALVEKFAKAVDAVGIAQQETRLDVLVEIADIINDKKVEDEMDGDGISMETIRYASELPTTTSKFKDRAVAIVAERQQVGWHKFKEDYKVVARNVAQKTAEKIMKADPDSAYQLEVLVEALEKGIISEGNIGYSAVQLKEKVGQTTIEQKERNYRDKYRPFFDENKERAVDNLDYLDQIKLGQINDPIEMQVAEQIIEDISYFRMENILNNIQKGHDVSYMKIVGNELMEKGYRAQLHFSSAQLALLQ